MPAARCRKRSCSTATRGDAAGRDETVPVLHRHPEREPPALDRLEHGLGEHLVADRDRREVVELHPVADGRVAGRDVPVDRGHGGPFGEQHDARGRQDRDVAAAQRERGVAVADDVSHGSDESGFQRHGRTIRNPHPTARTSEVGS